MALDTLDLAVLAAVAAALVAYALRGKLWAVDPVAVAAVPTSLSDIAEVLRTQKKRCVVFYGSQTGTAEDYAHRFAKELTARMGLLLMVADLELYEGELLVNVPEDTLAFFFMATYGEGDPTDNACTFVEYMDLAEGFDNLRFTVFGLGNTTYEFYNAVGRRVDKQLKDAGAKPLGPYGEGDDGKGTMDEDYLAWKELVFELIHDELGIEQHAVAYQPQLEVTEQAEDKHAAGVSLGEPNSKHLTGNVDGPFDHNNPYLAPVSTSRELFADPTRLCIHAEFDLSALNVRYSTGDHLALWPLNALEHVDALLAVLGLAAKRDQVIAVSLLDPTTVVPFPSPTTYEAVVRHYLEITGPISREWLNLVAAFAPTDEAKAQALAWSSNKDVFKKEVLSHQWNLADVLSALLGKAPWTVPFLFVIELVAKLTPRYYSILSLLLSEKRTVHITAVVEAEKVEGRVVTGVATNLLRHLQLAQNKASTLPTVHYDLEGPHGSLHGYKLPVHIRRLTFRLPTNPASPVIMVGPGTGVAPFRGFVRDRVHQVVSGTLDADKVGPMVLFYGCRTSTEDFLYRDEWSQYSKQLGSKFELVTAFSREGADKVYVQHRMVERATQIAELLLQGAFVYVCGDAGRMAREVAAAFVEIAVLQQGILAEKATAMFRQMKVQNRYQEDVW